MPSENSDRPVLIEVFLDLVQASWTMIPAFLAVLTSFRSLFRSRVSLQAEVLSLRHQLLILERQGAGSRVSFRTSDRILWAYLSRI